MLFSYLFFALLVNYSEYLILFQSVNCLHPARIRHPHHFSRDDYFHHHRHHRREKELNPADHPIVTTEWSRIQGFVRKVSGRNVAHFLGIPYAIPPVGLLRFRPPKPLRRKHHGIYHANSFRSACLQTHRDEEQHAGTNSSEHCLFLNVYSPWEEVGQASKLSNNSGNQQKLRPALVFIHGSGYVYGSSANPHMYGGYLSSIGDLVFVIFNYRLGALGLMYGGHEKMPGNAALYDQKLALEWIKKNIHHFHGDPERVTVMGHSAGATYQTIHMFSKESRNLFTSAIIMSGNACERNGIDSPEQALRRTRTLLNRVGCQSINSFHNRSTSLTDTVKPLTDDEIKCLQRVDGRRLVNAQFAIDPEEYKQGYENACSFPSFLPVYRTDFLSDSTDSLLQQGNFRKNISLLIGKVPKEGNNGDEESFNRVQEGIEYVSRKFILTLGSQVSPSVDALIRFYFENAKDGDEMSIKRAVVRALNDLCNHCPTLKFAGGFAKYNNVFLYYYTYIREKFRQENSRPYGSTHADDTRLLFGLPFKDYEEYGDEDRKVSVNLIRLWSKFVHEAKMPWQEIGYINGRAVPYQFNITGNFEKKDVAVDPDDAVCRVLI